MAKRESAWGFDSTFQKKMKKRDTEFTHRITASCACIVLSEHIGGASNLHYVRISKEVPPRVDAHPCCSQSPPSRDTFAAIFAVSQSHFSVSMEFPHTDQSPIGFVKEEDRDGDAMYVGITKTHYPCTIRLDWSLFRDDSASMVDSSNETALKHSKTPISPFATRFRKPSLGGSQPQPTSSSSHSGSAARSGESSSDHMDCDESEAYVPLDSIASKYGVQTDTPKDGSHTDADKMSAKDISEVDSGKFRMPTLRAASWGKEPLGDKPYVAPFNGGTTSSVTFPPPKAGGRTSPDESKRASTSRRDTISSFSTLSAADPEADARDSWKTGWSRPQAPRSLRPRPESTPGRIMEPKRESNTPEMDISGDEGGESEVDELEEEDEEAPKSPTTSKVSTLR